MSGQTVIPATIRERFALGPSQRLEWFVDNDGSIRVVPVVASPVQAFADKADVVEQQRGFWRIGSSIETLNGNASFFASTPQQS